MIEKLKQTDFKALLMRWVMAIKGLLDKITNSAATAKIPTDSRESQISEEDLLSTLVQLTAEKKSLHPVTASYHPFINFLISKRKQLTEDEQKAFAKLIANFETFLMQVDDDQQLESFYSFFASKQGLVLFRCSLISIRYFSRMMNKLMGDKPRFLAVFAVLMNPQLLECKDNYDQLLQAILTKEDIASLQPEQQQQWVIQLIQ